MAITWTCTNCSSPATEIEPCRSCGGTGKNMHAELEAHGTSMIVSSAAITAVNFDDARLWTEKWFLMEYARNELREIYGRAEPLNNLIFERVAREFFSNCLDLVEWLALHQNIGKAQIEKYFRSFIDMEIAFAYVNTFKHRDLSLRKTEKATGSKRLHAARHEWSFSPNRMSIKYWTDPAAPMYVDALALADECMKQWTAYLIAKGITVPDPQ